MTKHNMYAYSRHTDIRIHRHIYIQTERADMSPRCDLRKRKRPFETGDFFDFDKTSDKILHLWEREKGAEKEKVKGHKNEEDP